MNQPQRFLATAGLSERAGSGDRRNAAPTHAQEGRSSGVIRAGEPMRPDRARIFDELNRIQGDL